MVYLIVKMSSLGDIIQAYKAGEYLKQKDPQAKVVWLVEDKFKDVIHSFPFVDLVLSLDTYKIRKKPFRSFYEISAFLKKTHKLSFDYIFDLQGNFKSSIVMLLLKSKNKVGFSKKCVAEKINLLVTHKKIDVDIDQNISHQYLQVIKKSLRDESSSSYCHPFLKVDKSEQVILEALSKDLVLRSKPIFMVCPHSHWTNKQLSEKTLIRFLKKLQDLYHPTLIFIYGNKQEKQKSTKWAQMFFSALSIGQLKISTWYGLMKHVDCVISVDSSALHLAAIADRPTFSFFGPSLSSVYKPYGAKHQALQGLCPYDMTFHKRCKKLRSCADAPCMKEFQEQEMIEKFVTFFHSVQKNHTSQSL